ncbi:CotH kinase family protein [Porphyromonadaceae sp. NP-X]|nr:CotH kinase family protein [Porphyromonadaceae sp. NP-X]
MKKVFPLLFLFFSSSFLNAQTSSLLNGNIIGTRESVDYTTNQSSTTVNTIRNVFDNDFNTFFASYERSGTWVGLDLGAKHVITKIGYSPRISYPARVQLALIEGANSPDFSDAVPLYLIPNAAAENVMTYADVNCSRGFRYVRYVSPSDVRCNLAELQFYGYESEGTNTKFYQVTNLPTVSIHTENSQDVVSKDVYLKGIVNFISDNGNTIYTDSTSIKGRGNASWNFPKKPYKLKLYNKVNLLGMPAKAKEWTLINNYGDKTLMRNMLAFKVSKMLDMPYTPAGTCVDVILNGEYKGTYQLCDQIEVQKNRVNITEMEPTDIALPNLSGGYLLEVDAYAYTEISWFNSTRGNPVTIHSPDDDEIVPQQTQYITDFFNTMEQEVYGRDFANDNASFRKHLDTKTFLKNLLIGEFCGNTDTYWSTYMYKQRNNDTLYTGPIWDYDLSFENDNRTYPINNLTDFIYRTNGSAAGNMRTFVDNVLASNASKRELYNYWNGVRSEKLTQQSMISLVDSLATLLDSSQKLNFIRWPILNTLVHQNPLIGGSYQNEVNNVKNYISGRLTWMDSKLLSLYPGPQATENPTIGKLFVEHDKVLIQGYDHPLIYKIFSINGQIISMGSLPAGQEASESLHTGIFVVQLQDLLTKEKSSQKVFISDN